MLDASIRTFELLPCRHQLCGMMQGLRAILSALGLIDELAQAFLPSLI